ncbi:MAG: Holliday junction branch migration protein RuvA [Deltaproteobacteria bacterium]|nr:Holliday junction branch migration protein RuvA [Deltaproteobacteria bacterium]
MIARLRGMLAGRDGTDVIVDVNGVGYEVVCSLFTLAALPPDGETVTLRIYTQALESKITLYGFLGADERALFDLLITVKNVGPSTAIGILSGGHAPRDIAELIARGEVARLVKIKGVGKKTAEMLVVELREKCEMLLLTLAAGAPRTTTTAPPPRTSRGPLLDDVASALAQMGWRPAEVEKVVAELTIDDGATVEGLLRQALRAMPR